MAAAFSYAQAAKGVASPQASQTPSESATPMEQTTEDLQTSADVAVPNADAPSDVGTATVDNEKEANVNDVKADVSETSTAQTSTISKEDEGSNIPNGTSESTWDKQSQASVSDKPDAGSEGAKGKTEKEKPAPPKELKAAPLPSVNIWQQRREAQDAKSKAAGATKPAAKTGISKPTSETSSISGDNHDQAKIGSKKKGGESSEKKKGDGVKGREESAPVPSVADATLWPTPHVAQGEEKKKAQERTAEKSEKSPVIRPHGKEKWTPVPYVPTAVFNTPLPSGARRGGRSARGGRDTARNGAHAVGASEKTAQGAATKQTTSGDRGRNESNSTRANSLPAPSRRSNSADNAPADARKLPVTDRNRAPKGLDATSATKQVNGDAFSRNAKPFPKNHEGGFKGGDNKNFHLSVDTRSGPNFERRFENGPKTADFSGLDRKDKEFSREPRAERGRGSHRGRGGGHAGYNGAQTSHFPNNHMAPQGYMHPKSFGFNDRRGPQQHGLANGSRGHPMTLRSPSLPTSSSMYNMYPAPTDMNNMYGYQQVQPGPMSAVPYGMVPMEQFSLMSIISMQLEYYFSVDNLCKDIYLRKHMDSQGFVALSVIAAFKRVKSLTEDFELLRHVSRNLRVAEHYMGEDGVDRLRPRGGWEQWVIPLEQRDSSAQNAGPRPSTNQNQHESSVAHSQLDGATNGFVPKYPLSNGNFPSKTTLSSAAPEFSPSNGVHHTGTEVSNWESSSFSPWTLNPGLSRPFSSRVIQLDLVS